MGTFRTQSPVQWPPMFVCCSLLETTSAQDPLWCPPPTPLVSPPVYLHRIQKYLSHAVFLITPSCFFTPPPADTLPSDPLQSQYDSWLSLVDHLNIKAFVNLTLADSVRHGIQHLLFISGLGRWRHHHVPCSVTPSLTGVLSVLSRWDASKHPRPWFL